MDERMVEIAAQGMFGDGGGECWDAYEQKVKDWYRSDALCAIRALLDAGYTILPPVEGKVT